MRWDNNVRATATCLICGTSFFTQANRLKNGRGRFCGKLCFYRHKSEHPRLSLAERFWSKVDKTSSSHGCWLWIGKPNSHGYGQIEFGGRKNRTVIMAHRLSWMLAYPETPIPEKWEVCHNCPGGDNPACVNPDHLFLGTHTDNMRDMSAKGHIGARTHPERVPRGERHGSRTHPERFGRRA